MVLFKRFMKVSCGLLSEKAGKLDLYSEVYRRQLKHRILAKQKTLTDDLIAVKEVLDKLQEI